MKWLGGLLGLVGYTLAYLEDREGKSTARNKCPDCWFGIVCDEKRPLGKGMSPLWTTCKWGRYRQELIKREEQAMKKVDPYEIDSDIVKEALEKGWVPPDPESLEGKLHDTLPKLSASWNGPLQVMADLIPQRRHAEVAQTLVAFTEPISVYQFLADVYLTDELEED